VWGLTQPYADDMTDAEPNPSPVSPTKPSPTFRHHQPDALKPNPHPYPIKTTSTGVLSRSNSTTKSTSPYQYYVPQSPRSPNTDGHNVPNGGMERRGGRHKYGKSLTSDLIPSPLPVPPAEDGHRARSDSSSSLASDTNAFGVVAEGSDIAGPWLGRKPRRATVAALEASIAASGTDAGGKKGTYHTIGRRTGGKVKGMVASFERSASRSEDSDSDGEAGSSYARRSYGRRRHRSGSNASDRSAGSSSSSSFSTASSGPFPPDVAESTSKLKVSLSGMVVHETILIYLSRHSFTRVLHPNEMRRKQTTFLAN
jgi:hypothetical protein